MRLLTTAELEKLSFPDATIEDMNLDIPNLIANIKINSGYLSVNGGIKLSSCNLTIKNWHAISALRYHANTKEWERLNINYMEKLVDVCEFDYGAELTFRGFGASSGQWLEITFSHAELEVECS